MFYCEECRKKKKWPESFATSYGRCEICEKSETCYDTPSRNLPKEK